VELKGTYGFGFWRRNRKGDMGLVYEEGIEREIWVN
jgi:hypothetical protein